MEANRVLFIDKLTLILLSWVVNHLLLYWADLLSNLMLAMFLWPFELLEVVSHVWYLVFVLKDSVCKVLTGCSGGSNANALGAVSLSRILATSIIHDFSFPTLVFSIDIVNLLGNSRGLWPVKVALSWCVSLRVLVAHIIFLDKDVPFTHLILRLKVIINALVVYSRAGFDRTNHWVLFVGL